LQTFFPALNARVTQLSHSERINLDSKFHSGQTMKPVDSSFTKHRRDTYLTRQDEQPLNDRKYMDKDRIKQGRNKKTSESHSQDINKSDKHKETNKGKPIHKKKMKVALDEFFGRKNRQIQPQKCSSSVLSDEVTRFNTLLDGKQFAASDDRTILLANTADKLDTEAVKHFFKYDPVSLKSSQRFKRSHKEEAAAAEELNSHVEPEVVADVELFESLKQSLSEEEWNTVLSVTKSMPKTRISLEDIQEREKKIDPFHEEDKEAEEWDMSESAIYEDVEAQSIQGSITKKV